MTNETTCKQAGRLGGLAKSPAKTKACRANGKLGGRPKKKLGEYETRKGIKLVRVK